jgi:hypothetical protein
MANRRGGERRPAFGDVVFAASFVGAVALGAAGCRNKAALPAGEVGAAAVDPLHALHEVEEARRAATDFAHLPPSSAILGPDPIAVRHVPIPDEYLRAGSGHFVGLLRGESAVVLLDESLREIARVPAPASPTGLAVGADGEVLVSGELSPEVVRYRVKGRRIRRAGSLRLDGVLALRDVALGPEGVMYAVEEHDGRLITVPLPRLEERTRRPARPEAAPADREGAEPRGRAFAVMGNGAFRVERAGEYVVVDCLLDHELVVRPVDAKGFPMARGEVRIRHDGPIWGFDAMETPEGLIVVSGGVEDHPIDRTQGSFGFIDSFVFLDRIAKGATAATHLSEVNVSELGVITPKSLDLRESAGGVVSAFVAGYGGTQLAELTWSSGDAKAVARTFEVPPGIARTTPAEGNALAFADPLVDAFGVLRDGAASLVPVAAPAAARTSDSKLGEALFFTTLMAPWNSSEGRLSRFTCETCHFEGYGDGRTHATGRGDIHATTKPLLGLFNNRPHFSRALDPDLTTVADNEFRVAGANSGHDPWFSVDVGAVPWLGGLGFGGRGAMIGPEELRRALMAFLMDFTHRPNPAVVGRTAWSAVEREGAEVFRDRCEGCHAARLVSDVEGSRVPFEGWEGMVMAKEGALVWGRAGYEKTGVVPYVNELGARVPSLRRLYKKRPYFTNGAAKDLRAVLDRARFGAGVFFHDEAPEGAEVAGLDERSKEGLLAFLDLL